MSYLLPEFNPINLIIGVLAAALAMYFLPTPANRPFFALVMTLITLVISTHMYLFFDKTVTGFQFLQFREKSDYGSSPSLGVDGLSLIFLLLTLVIMPICILAAWNVTHKRDAFIYMLLLVTFLLVLTFATSDLFYFYVFFEGLLIPMFMLIGYWGSRERKIKASYYFFMYTLGGSLIMLFGVIYLYLVTGTSNFAVILHCYLSAEQQKFLWFCFFMAFAVKMPLFPFHIWLPEAHVEAPTVGSMILASLLLKLGGYGFLRLTLTMLPEGSAYFFPVISVLPLLGVVFGSLATIRQIDLKRIIAYSSVAHMNLVMLGLFSENQQGIDGAIYLMIAHGVVSTALFFCVGVLYDRYHSRILRYYSGLVVVAPVFAGAFFVFTLANMGFPGTSNFLGELLVFVGLSTYNPFTLIVASTSIILSAVYSVWLFNRVVFGTLKTAHISRFTDVTTREAAILGLLGIQMLILGLTAPFLLGVFFGNTKILLFGLFFFRGSKAPKFTPVLWRALQLVVVFFVAIVLGIFGQSMAPVTMVSASYAITAARQSCTHSLQKNWKLTRRPL